MWFKNSHDAENGKGEGPLTSGEAMALVAMITGCDMEEVEAFVVTALMKCPNCGLAHNVLTSTNVDDLEAIHVMHLAANGIARNLYYG